MTTAAVVVAVFVAGLAILAVPAKGLAYLPLPAPGLFISAKPGQLSWRSQDLRRPGVAPSTSMAADPRLLDVARRRTMEVTSLPRRRGLNPGAGDTAIRDSWSSRRASNVICGAGGDGGDGSVSEDNNDDQQDGSLPEDDDEEDDSSPPPTFSFAAVEEELKSRSIPKATTWGNAVAEGGTAAAVDEDVFFPPQFPSSPSSSGGGPQGEGEGGKREPLIELPIDGVLLQLFPALLIAVVGVFLTIAVQVEAGRFDAMVGDDGGAVVVTDLRDTP